MQNIMLKQLSLDMGKTEYDMLQGIPAVENGFTNPVYNLSYDEYKEWLRITDKNSIGKDLPEGWIPYTTYFLYIDDIPVGYGRVRHSSSEYLETVVGAGNLGYGIKHQTFHISVGVSVSLFFSIELRIPVMDDGVVIWANNHNIGSIVVHTPREVINMVGVNHLCAI